MPSEDYTFCVSYCQNEKCIRHGSNIKNKDIPHSFSDFSENCENYFDGESYPNRKPTKWILNGGKLSIKHTNVPVIECKICHARFCDVLNDYTIYSYCPNCGEKMTE